MGCKEFGQEEARGAKVTKSPPGLAFFKKSFYELLRKGKKKDSLASFFFFNYLCGVFMVETWSGLLPFMMTDAWVRGRERGLDTWRVFELLGTEVSGPLKNPGEGCL